LRSKENPYPLKRCFVFLLPAVLFAGSAIGQSTDSTRAPMQGELKEVQVRDPLAKWKSDYAENRLLYRKKLKYATLKPIRKPLVKIGELGFTLHDFWSVLALRASGKQKKYLKFKTELERNETEDLSNIRYTKAVVMRVTNLEDSAAGIFIKQNPMTRNFLMVATELEFLQWIRDRQKCPLD
jgi:hypothetical protein